MTDFLCSQPYKYLLALRLIDYGKNSIALQYLESIAIDLLKSQSDQNLDLAHNVLELSERIKYSDSKPLVADSVDKPWLSSLRELVNGVSIPDFVNVFPILNSLHSFLWVQKWKTKSMILFNKFSRYIIKSYSECIEIVERITVCSVEWSACL